MMADGTPLESWNTTELLKFTPSLERAIISGLSHGAAIAGATTATAQVRPSAKQKPVREHGRRRVSLRPRTFR
jgi:hypothetical protein